MLGWACQKRSFAGIVDNVTASADTESDLASLSFEEILDRLEGVVSRLEQGDAPLEEALSTFEQGVALSRQGNQRLDSAERRIEQLLQSGETAPLETGSENVRARRAPSARKSTANKETTGNE